MRAVLTYHSLDESRSPISVSGAAFRRHVEWLARERVTVLPLESLLADREERDAVAITFDDGFRSVATEAAPVLRERGWPAVVFVVSDRVGQTNDWGDRPAPGIPSLPLLDWPALGRLAEGGFALGAHSRTHPRLPALDDAVLGDEVGMSGDRIARETGRRPSAFAYPYGAVDRRVARVVGERYASAVTTEHRVLRSHEDRALIPRLDMYYFRDRDPLPPWNGFEMRRDVWLRRQARRARALLSPSGRP
jgi:peptidoglycan/xylan/chitin deacetylase (PgdA/CDA1 family)